MKESTELADIQGVSESRSYHYDMSLVEFNGYCRIIYSTNTPLLCSGTINLCTTDGPKIVAYEVANSTGGHFDTGKPWGSGYYAQWNVVNSENQVTIIGWTPTTKQS